MPDTTPTAMDAAEHAPDRALLRRWPTWVYLVLVLASLLVVVPRLVSMLDRPEYLRIAWVGGIIQAAALLLFGWLVLPRRRASASMVLLSMLIGATFCVGAALLLANAADGLRLERFVVVPVIEEIIKTVAIVIVLLMLRPRLRGPLDGLMIGFWVGFGFAIIENILYTYDGSTRSGAWVLVIARLLTQFGSHVIFSAIVGAGLAYVIVSRGSKWWVAIAAFAVALGLHLAWDVPAIWIQGVAYLGVTLVVYAAGIVVFFAVRRISARYEERVLAG